MPKKAIIKNERDLIKQAVEGLEKYTLDSNSTNIARMPIIIIGLGEKSERVLYEIRRTLDNNWSNAMHLEFFHVVRKSGSDWIAKRFRCQEEYDDELNQHPEADRNEWINCTGTLDEEITRAIYRMLEKRDNFAETGGVKVDFIIDATEQYAQDYYEFSKSFSIVSNHLQYKSLFILLSQKNIEGALSKSEKMLQTVLHDKDISRDSVYLLSDELNDGSSLSEEDLKINYRLLADLIFLGGDRENASSGLPALEAGLKFVSYTTFSKPSDQIGEVSIGHLLDKVYKVEKKFYSDKPIENDEIKSRLGVSRDGSVDIIEQEWEKFRRTLPNEKQNPILYFPYAEKNGIKIFMREAKRSISAGIAKLNELTYGVSNNYLKLHYSESIEKYIEERELYSAIYKFVKSKFSYFELLKMHNHIGDIKASLSFNHRGTPEGRTYAEKFQKFGEMSAKESFFDRVHTMICDVLEELCKQAIDFKSNYEKICAQVKIARSVNGEEEASIEEYYGNQVEKYLMDMHDAFSDIDCDQFFDVSLDKAGMLQRLYDMYIKMIRSVDIYSYSFEKELLERINGLNSQGVNKLINDYFSDNLKKNLRLHPTTDVGPELVTLGNYFMLNTQAGYFTFLKESQDFKEGKYKLVELRRSDSVEQLAIYSIKNIERLSLDAREKKVEDSKDLLKKEYDAL